MVAKHRKYAREARNSSIKFLYQCEAEKLFYFSRPHFTTFCDYQQVPAGARAFAEEACRGVFARMREVDQFINETSKKWPVERMPAMDRSVLRLAVWELLGGEQPGKVVINEAIELAKIYGTEHSSGFVNGILDALLPILSQSTSDN